VTSLERDRGLVAATVVARRTRREEAAARAVEMYSKSVTTLPTGSCTTALAHAQAPPLLFPRDRVIPV
jgi:hypothetical protein